MAMLAEPRRKQRIGPNPRGKFFTEDEDNRGRQMLKKMGWKTGDGLGATSHGMKEPIKPKVHTDARGLGYDRKKDPWVAHNEEFEQLLKNLHTAEPGESLPKPVSADDGDDSSNSANEGLEKKSKGSRSRIHYHKFVRNKDLSRASAKDISCIFGNNIQSEQPESVPVQSSGDVIDAPDELEDCNMERNTKKRKSKKRKHSNSDDNGDIIDEAVVSNACSPDQPEETETPAVVEKKKSKKHKKSKELVETFTADLENIQTNELVTTKKKKKHKMVVESDMKTDETKNILEEQPNNGTPSVEANNEESNTDVTKRKKKKKCKDEGVNVPSTTELLNNVVENAEIATSEESVPKKKKKKSKSIANVEDIVKVEEETEHIPEESKTKKNKKRKRDNKEEDKAIVSSEGSPNQPEACEPEECETEAISIKKKKKKRKHETDKEMQETEQMKEPEVVSNTNDSSKTSETDKLESFGSLTFINRGSIVDYFRSKMQSRLLSSSVKM